MKNTRLEIITSVGYNEAFIEAYLDAKYTNKKIAEQISKTVKEASKIANDGIYNFIVNEYVNVCDELSKTISDTRRIKLTGERKAYKNILDAIKNLHL